MDVATDRDTALGVSAAKTPSYSVVLTKVTAAAMAGCGPSTVEALRSAGRDPGIAYQAMDGVLGDPEVTVKSVNSDLRQRVPTVIHVHSRAHPSWQEISVALDDDPERARELLNAVIDRRVEITEPTALERHTATARRCERGYLNWYPTSFALACRLLAPSTRPHVEAVFS